jgi:glycosyltransferase involved in cell wall biosynthesis
MRILHVIWGLKPFLGGPPRVATRLAAGQATLGHEVTIVSYPLGDSRDDFRAMTRLMPGFDRVRVVEVENGGALESVFAHRADRVLKPLIDEVDIVHLHDVWHSLVRSAGATARRAGKPYVVQPNDSLNPYSLSQKRLKKWLGLALAYRRMIEGSAAVIFGHSEEMRLVRQAGFRIEPVVAGLGGVFREEVEPLPPPGRFYQRVPQLRARPYVLFLSRINHKKGPDYLADGFAVAARSVPDLQLVMIGQDDGAQADFEQRVAALGLTDRVHLVGPMHGQDKWEAFRDAVCFCLPSRDEAFTVAIMEALACGLPVVISEACHFDDVGEYQAGFIVPLEASRIGEALTRLCTDPALRARMSNAAQRLFSDRLCFNRVADEVVTIYEQCLARRDHR